MRITDKDVSYIADLANLELTAQERQHMVKDLDSILSYIDKLNELDTSDVPPMAQLAAAGENAVTDSKSIPASREDQLRPCLPRTEAMQNAPATDGQFFKVPKVIER
jgi:aspartyl-tRNA(Asn)/glutamyl-tRNA(Gln) amidotransferase subunit C